MVPIVKNFLMGLNFLVFFAISIPFYPIFIFAPKFHRKYIVRLVSFSAKLAIRLMNIKIKFNGMTIDDKQAYLIVSNHLSYLDVLIMATIYPGCFVTSVEIKNTPFLGHICRLAGCLFVERRSRSGLGAEVQEIKDALLDGTNVVIFPEATSTNGESVLRFKRPLFQAVIDENISILPICINYKTIDGSAVTTQNRDRAFWYGDMDFLPHYLGVLSSKEIVCEVKSLELITDTQSNDITELSIKAHSVVNSNYNPIV